MVVLQYTTRIAHFCLQMYSVYRCITSVLHDPFWERAMTSPPPPPPPPPPHVAGKSSLCSTEEHKLSYVTVSETEAQRCNSASVTLFSIKLNDITRQVYRNRRMLRDAVTHDAQIVMMMMMMMMMMTCHSF